MNTSNFQTPLAIIGYSCCFPGGIDSPSKYWDLLANGRSVIDEIPDSRLARKYYFQPETTERGKSYSILGACIDYDLYRESVEKMISGLPAYQELSDDEGHRLSLYTAAQALKHAGFDIHDVSCRNTGVYIGHSRGSKQAVDWSFAHHIESALRHLNAVDAYHDLSEERRRRMVDAICRNIHEEYLPPQSTGLEKYWSHYAAKNISKAFGFQGPSLIINCACASSLIGISLAAEALHGNLIDMALVGGASYLKFDSMIHFAHAQSLSTTGSCPFDEKADGFVPSEGHVYAVLKTLRQAKLDGNRIHAVIRGVGISSDGKGKGLWAPRQEGQIKAIERAYRGKNNELVRQLDHIEAHATSTQLGDATELTAIHSHLESMYPEHLRGQKRIHLGSCKANIGHTLESAGLSGLVKVLLEMENETIVRQANLDQPVQMLDSLNNTFEIPRTNQPWKKTKDHARTVGVNAFGIGGLNAHVVLQDDQPDDISQKPSQTNPPIAVIGMSCILPKANYLDEFQQLLRQGSEMKGPAPDRWNLMFSDTSIHRNPQEKTIPRKEKLRGGYITDYAYDWKRHKVPPLQVKRGNPLQFMILDAVNSALDDAGFSESKPLPNETTGVVIGSRFDSDFANELQIGMRLPEIRDAIDRQLQNEGLDETKRKTILDEYSKIVLDRMPALNDESGSFTTSTLASRIAKTYDLMGGAIAVDAGSCSSFAALDVALNSLRNGSMDIAICGGGQQSVGQYVYHEMLHHDGAISPPAEGVAVLILKRLDDAVKDGDHVHAVLHGMASKLDKSLAEAERKSLKESLASCTFKPDTLCVAELAVMPHENEVAQLREGLESLEEHCPAGHRVFAGSLSTQMGHAFGASGIFSLIKTILELRGLFVAPSGMTRENGDNSTNSKKSILEFSGTCVELPKETPDGRIFGVVSNADRDGTVYTLLLERGTPVSQCRGDKTVDQYEKQGGKRKAPLPTHFYDDVGHSAFERGRNHGIQFAKTIRESIYRMKSLSKVEKSFLADQNVLVHHQKEILFPAWALEELHGMAEGCKLPVQDLFHYNMNLFPGCVQFLINCAGEFLHGMNLDMPLYRLIGNDFEEVPVLIRRRFVSGHVPYIYASVPGQVGCIVGVNAEGISVTSSMLLDRSRDKTPEGFSHPFLVAEVLEKSKNVDAALNLCCQWQRGGSWGMIISDATALRPTYIEYHGPVLRMEQKNSGFVSANHSLLSKNDDTIPSHSESRLNRMASLLEDNPPSLANGLSLLRDRMDWKTQTVPKHRTMHSLLRLDNLLSWAFVPSKRLLYLAKTPHDSSATDSESPYECIDLTSCFVQTEMPGILNVKQGDVSEGLAVPPRSAISHDEFAAVNTSSEGKPPINPGQGICHRFVMRTVPADIPEPAVQIPDHTFLLVGRNSIVDILYDRIAEQGGNAKKLDISGPWDAVLRRFDKIDEKEKIKHVVFLTDHNAIVGESGDGSFDTEKWNHHFETGYYRSFELLQHWLRKKQSPSEIEEISVLSSSLLGGDFGFSEQVKLPQGGAFEGLMKALRREMNVLKKADLKTKYVDHGADVSPDEIAGNLFAELTSCDAETEIGYVNGKRYTSRPVLAPIREATLANREKQARKDLHGTWIFTGGAQGITAVVAREFGRNFNCKLKLVGSTPLESFDPSWRLLDKIGLDSLKKKVMKDALNTKVSPLAAWQKIEKMLNIDKNLREMQILGIDVEYFSCDVRNENEVRRLVDHIAQKEGPVVGFVHGAGFESSCRFEKKKPDNVKKTMEIKVSGARSFMKFLDPKALKYFIGFGSTSGRFGGVGQADYSAANDTLSKLLEWYGQYNENCRTLCIQWTAWDDVGMAVRPESKEALKTMERKFLPSLEGARHFMNELVLGLPEPEVAIVEWDYYKRFYPDEIALPYRNIRAANRTEGSSGHSPSVELGVVQETLLIPLYFRAKEAERKDAIVRDEKAVAIMDKINYDFGRFKNDRFLQLEIAIRTEVLDLSTKNFIKTFPDAVVVNLGAGLDDRLSRVDNGAIRWFDLDLPDSMNLRRRFFQESDRNFFLDKSMFDYTWIDDVFRLAPDSQTKPVLFIGEGLCQYFTEEKNKSLFKTIADHFPRSYMLVHSICPYTAEHTNISISVSATRAKFKWGIQENYEMESWDPRYKLLEDWHFIKRHAWRWIKLGIPTIKPQHYKFYYQNMKVGLLSLGELSSKHQWKQEIK